MKLYAKPDDARSNKILIAAKYSKTEIKLDPDFKFPQDCRKKEFKDLNPVGKVPVLATEHGPLFESNAILRFVGRQGSAKLYGSNNYEAGLVDQWIDFSANEIQLPADAWLYPIWEYIDNHPGATAKAQSDIRKVLSILNVHLQSRTFLVGERISLADIAVAGALYPLYTEVLDPKTRKPFANTNRWLKTLVNQPEFLAVLGTFHWCEKTKVAPSTNANQTAQTVKQATAEPKKQPQQPKKAPAPEKETDEAEERDENEPPSEPKKPNPLDSLPPTKFILDEWKRVYSNEDTHTVAMPWFWEHLDEAGWSLWFADYMYNDELTKLFSTLNLAGGFIQRLDKVRKYAFGSLVIFGEEPKLELSLCFFIRGTELPEILKEVDDFELYKWRKVDTKDEAQKKLVEDYWAWDGNFGGKTFKDGKIFK